MNKLLSAHFMRLRKSNVFWGGMILMFLFGVGVVWAQYNDHLQGYEVKLDTAFFAFAAVIAILCAVFCSLFLGTEYSDGTIRNKLVVGHTRASIYLSSLITSIAAACLMCLAYLVAVTALGIPLLGFVTVRPLVLTAMLAGSFLMVCAVCSLLTMVCMLNENKALTAVICIIGVFLLLVFATNVKAKLDAPEFYEGYVLTDSLGNVSAEQIPSPDYLTGTKRTLYEYLYDFLPTGQALQYSGMTAVHLWQMPLYSLFILTATTGIGILVFRRKDIK